MRDPEEMLLKRLVRHGDAEAFSAIMGQYAGMVYSTCRRVLGSDAQAADVAQETFFQFLKNAPRVTGSIGGWLHQAATHRALDLVRQSASRRQREEAYATNAFQKTDNWGDIEPLVDEAMAELPEDLRELLIQHYLRGQSMTEIAAAKGISQPTVSRRVAVALEQVREKLRARDVVVSLATLGAFLPNSVQAAPAPLLDALGKMALAQAASSSAAIAASTTAPLFMIGANAAVVAASLALATGAIWIAANHGVPENTPYRGPTKMPEQRGSKIADPARRQGASTNGALAGPRGFQGRSGRTRSGQP